MLISFILVRTVRFVLDLLGQATSGSDRNLRTRLKDTLGVKAVWSDYMPPEEEPVQETLVPAAA